MKNQRQLKSIVKISLKDEKEAETSKKVRWDAVKIDVWSACAWKFRTRIAEQSGVRAKACNLHGRKQRSPILVLSDKPLNDLILHILCKISFLAYTILRLVSSERSQS